MKVVLLILLSAFALITASAISADPHPLVYECNDGWDNDWPEDGMIDYGHDPGCSAYG